MTDALKPGDWVEVRSPEEIASSLDERGALEGLPFMPEMIPLCGRRFRVLRQAVKTCVEVAPGDYRIRGFLGDAVYLLEGQRCSGAEHDGCQRACMLFWKQSWLRKVDGEVAVAADNADGCTALRQRLTTRLSTGRYTCQSTHLAQATGSQSLHPWHTLRLCLADVMSGAVGPVTMVNLIVVPVYRKMRDRLVGRPVLRGTLTRTPVGTLGLQPGELVRIKSLDAMRTTLDSKGRNRGIVCDIELGVFSGSTDRVRGRLEKMISEPTGEMKHVEATVLLEGNLCMCARVVGGCPRAEFCYWREVWLERVEPGPQARTARNS